MAVILVTFVLLQSPFYVILLAFCFQSFADIAGMFLVLVNAFFSMLHEVSSHINAVYLFHILRMTGFTAWSRQVSGAFLTCQFGVRSFFLTPTHPFLICLTVCESLRKFLHYWKKSMPHSMRLQREEKFSKVRTRLFGAILDWATVHLLVF